jgi:hypothetical protein
MDDLSWRTDDDYNSDAAWAFASTVYLARGVCDDDPEDPQTVYTCKFVGRVVSIPRQTADGSESISYRAAGGWFWLEAITYGQSWQIMQTTDNALVTLPMPRVVIGQDNAGARRSIGAEIAAVIDWAIARGAPIAKGTIDALATCPYSEHTNITVAQVLRFISTSGHFENVSRGVIDTRNIVYYVSLIAGALFVAMRVLSRQRS